MGQQTIIFYERMVQTMNRNFNLPRLTETQKNALFAFGEKTKAGTGCNLMIAASMCEGDLTKAILMNLADLVETVGITDEEMEHLLYQVRMGTTENIMNMEKDYFSHILSNGLRIVHLPSASPVSYCGFAINAGTRDEAVNEFGLAHFVEHMIFKGTEKRKSWHILNRMENVGGELNAYTTKEETFVYSIFMAEQFKRAFDLLSDLVFH